MAGLALCSLAALVGACGSDAPADSEGACTAAVDCDDGQVCGDQVCGGCGSDDQCAADSRYGAGAECVEGLCEAAGCGPGEAGCACLEDDVCVSGPGCADGVCEPCEDGLARCDCRDDDEDACDNGLVCDGATCVSAECVDGAEDCPCAADDHCDDDLSCVDDLCIECPADAEGCPCVDDECEADLICDEEDTLCRLPETCLEWGCAEYQTCDESDLEAVECLLDCEEGYVWDSTGGSCIGSGGSNCLPVDDHSIASICADRHRVCEESGGGADCGDCVAGTVESGSACEAAMTCSDLTCAASNRQCVAATDSAHAACGDCLIGFEQGTGGACQAVENLNCDEDLGDSDSIFFLCADEHRSCDVVGETAECGDCLGPEFVHDPDTSTCIPFVACADFAECEVNLLQRCEDDAAAGVTAHCVEECVAGATAVYEGGDFVACEGSDDCAAGCPDGTECVQSTPSSPPRCEPARCLVPDNPGDPGEAYDIFNRACVPCTCDGEGTTGYPWPVTTFNGVCVCETTDGYFFNTKLTDRAPEPCDADDDGWVRRTAFDFVNEPDDLAKRQNARCTVREIDRFELRNEYLQSLEVRVMDMDLPTPDDTLELYELTRNDRQEDIDADADLAPASGRRPFASELNSLTRACIGIDADVNANGLSDIREWDEAPLIDPDEDEWLDPWRQMSFFIELHDGWYEPGAEADDPGRFIVSERSRCDSQELALGYEADVGPYWNSCHRRRAAGFNDDHHIGYDFARYGCDPEDELGGEARLCPTLEPTVGDKPAPGVIQSHGLCADDVVLPPEDGVWRGMNHHSQFQCVQVVNTPEEAWEVAESSVFTTSNDVGENHVNRCEFVDCEGEGDDCVETTEVDLGAPVENNSLPSVSCDSETVEDVGLGAVTWIARRYRPHLTPEVYQRGCVDEWVEWPQLCPGGVERAIGEGVVSNFGRLICGCAVNFGGPDCDLGCPGGAFDTVAAYTNRVHVGGESEEDNCPNGYCPVATDEAGLGGGRTGYWMCGGLTASTPTSPVCGGDEDCSEGVCIEGACRSACGEGCGVGETCVDSICVPRFALRGRVSTHPRERTPLAAGSTVACNADTPCTDDGESCLGGFCYLTIDIGLDCATSMDCPGTGVCEDGSCRAIDGFSVR